jgi:hypothetical protein
MARRKVTHSRKDEDGDITALCNPGQTWSPRLKSGAISDIETGVHSYYVGSGINEVDIHVVDGPSGKYLRTDPDKTSKNNLDDLPDC